MTTLIVLYNLRDSASKEAYEKWAKETDVPTASNLSSIDDFKVYRLNTLMGTETPGPYQYCEVIQVNDMAKLGEEVGSDAMQKVSAQFQEFADNPLFIVSDPIA